MREPAERNSAVFFIIASENAASRGPGGIGWLRTFDLIMLMVLTSVRGALPGSERWTVVRLSPGAHPLDELAVRLSAVSGASAGSLLTEIEADERAVALALRQASVARTLDDRVVLVIDQFEELFTLCRDAQQRARFIGAVVRTALGYGSDGVLVVVALRADFYAACAVYPQLSTALQDNQVLVAAMGKDDLVQAVVEPARSQHLTVEPGLVDTILQDVGGEPGALPLLSHALRETWVRREGQLLTLRSYAESGGVRRAIATTAEGVYAALTTEEKQVARNLLLRLAEVGEVTYSRRRVRRSELASDGAEGSLLAAVLSKFVDARLVIVSEDSVEVAHEALIREWPRLRGWLNEDREGLLLHRYLTEAAEGWAALRRDPGELYRGARLAAVTEWAEAHHDRLNELERESLDTSQAVQRSELEAVRRRNRQLRGLALALGVLVAATILAAGVAQTQRVKADRQARLALSNQYVAEADLNRFRRRSPARAHRRGGLSGLQPGWKAARLRQRRRHHPALGRQGAAAGRRPLDARAKGVYSLAFSPDSALIASGHQDGTVRLWNLRTRQQIGRITNDRQGAVRNLSFSSDGRVIASTGDDAGVHLWEPGRSPRRARAFLSGASFLSPGLQVRSVAFLPRRRVLAVGYQDGKIRLWDIGTRRQLGSPLQGHTDAVADLAISADGSRILSGSADSTIRLWNVRDHRQLGPPLTGHTGGVVGIALNRDGRTAVSSGHDGTVVVWDTTRTIAVGTGLDGHRGYVQDVAFDGGGRRLASAGQDGTVRLWNARYGRQAGSPLLGHTGRVNIVAFAPDGRTLASGGFDGTVRFWDAERRSERGAPIATGGGVITGLVFSRDGRSIAISSVNGGLRLWDIRGRRPLGAPLIEGSVIAIAMSADGKLLVASDGERFIRAWDVATLREVGTPLYGPQVRSLAISPDGRILAAGTYEGPILTWDIPNRRPRGCCRVTAVRYGAWISIPAATCLLRAAQMDRSGCGTWPVSRTARSFLHPAGSPAWYSARMGSRSARPAGPGRSGNGRRTSVAGEKPLALCSAPTSETRHWCSGKTGSCADTASTSSQRHAAPLGIGEVAEHPPDGTTSRSPRLRRRVHDWAVRFGSAAPAVSLAVDGAALTLHYSTMIIV
jgi:WD40 repeat protein